METYRVARAAGWRLFDSRGRAYSGGDLIRLPIAHAGQLMAEGALVPMTEGA
jgi:hypothetical protein